MNNNEHRSIILAKSGEFWVFAYLFAKKDRANITDDELAAFRKLAALYRQKSSEAIARELEAGELEEICNAEK